MISENGINRLSLGCVRCVREVLLRKSVSLAAERLGITQPAVSQQIARFEKLAGVSILSRNGNAVSVRDDEVAKLVFAMVAAQDELIRLARDQSRGIIRLGLCDRLGAFYCRNERQYTSLSESYDLQIAPPSVLSDLFLRGELDLAMRPLFHHEPDAELVTTVPIVWVSPQRNAATEAGSTGAGGPVNVILETAMSPCSHYVDRQLGKLTLPHRVVARVDDQMVRLHLVAAGRGHATVPGFLERVLPGAIGPSPIFRRAATVRWALLFNSRRVAFNTALDLFDMITEHIASPPGRAASLQA